MVYFLLVVFLSVSVSATPKCPTNFTLFERVPTARNNFTKHWCMQMFSEELLKEHNRTFQFRENARAMCANHNSWVTVPENEKEANWILENVGAGFEGWAVDGELTGRCKAFFYRRMFDVKFNETGDCETKKALMFDDPNTDPSFVFGHMDKGPGNGNTQHSGLVYTGNVGSCLFLTKRNGTLPHFDLNYCNTQITYNRFKNLGVVCGTHAL